MEQKAGKTDAAKGSISKPPRIFKGPWLSASMSPRKMYPSELIFAELMHMLISGLCWHELSRFLKLLLHLLRSDGATLPSVAAYRQNFNLRSRDSGRVEGD